MGRQHQELVYGIGFRKSGAAKGGSVGAGWGEAVGKGR
jgi:hypothetical protein